jgi:hypothetical protein
MGLAELQADLAKYQAARDAILAGAQSYSINGRAVTRASLSDIEKTISALEARIGRQTRGGAAIKAPLLRD